MSDINKDLVDYVVSLDGESKETANFVKKLKKPSNYKSILADFNWSPKYFEKLDDTLIKLGYQGHDDAIQKIKEFLTKQINKMSVKAYNKATGAKLKDDEEMLKLKNMGVRLKDMLVQLRDSNAVLISVLSGLRDTSDVLSWSPTKSHEQPVMQLIEINYSQSKLDHFNSCMLPKSKLKL